MPCDSDTPLDPGAFCNASASVIPENADRTQADPYPCERYYGGQVNDSCATISRKLGISSSDIWDWNTWVHTPHCPLFLNFSYCVKADHTCGQLLIVGPGDTCESMNNATKPETGGWGNLTERNPQIAVTIGNGTCDEALKFFLGSYVCVGD
ncbi:hypothetical protein B0H14DRAFT_2587469 [Mycena olivaceomarginata]|nr:hypothetical protein B0H14DRAFT_2587469 [Mycena olivaceomarginata]